MGGVLRAAAFVVCLGLLFGLFVLAGAGWPVASTPPGVDIEDPAVAPTANAGEYTEVGGIVVETDPTVIEIDQDDGTTTRITLENAPPATVGESLVVDGTFTADGVLVVNRADAVIRAPWEIAYMYLISVVAVGIIAAGGANTWRVDRQTLSFSPREQPLHRTLLGGDRNG